MEDKNIRIFSVVMNVINLIVAVVILNNNIIENRTMFLVAFSALIIIYFINIKKFSKKPSKEGNILGVINTLIILFIVFLDSTGVSIVLILVSVGTSILNKSTKVGLSLALTNYIVYMLVLILKHEALNLYNISIITINFTFACVLTIAVKYELNEKTKAQLISKELEERTSELERAYERLQDLYEDKEEIIVLKERNRIAGEIHDTVGHILTTVTIQLEASKRLIKKDPDLALEKLNSAQQQVKTGLSDIRKSVRSLKDGEHLLDFADILKTFVEEVKKNNELDIEYDLAAMPKLDKKIENIIYRALQEGITNGIRHGKSNRFKINLNHENNTIQFTLQDWGQGFDKFKPGFGINNMKSKVEGVGGKFNIESKINTGVTIKIEIPIVEEN
ncbi:histidine kinase [Clostridium zeae]|uniref:histidine kinase n=1 Tax=Clostridium zeae TaxID=2759022 RepID=A0ABQ1EFI7_9CLOT|nr:sensor histidine kinase [Clostridium zeae]GFZ33587.1 histidine kinase [Clostridium zeae]